MRLFVFLTLATTVICDPIIIRSGLNKNQEHQQNSNIFDLTNIKGIANYEAEDGFNRDNESKHVKAQDSGKYDEENSQKKAHSDENNFADENFKQQGGNEFADSGKKNAHKKGHHKSGYTKSYHKDESSNNSSYYDDEDDQGDEYVRNTKKNAYGDAAQQNRRGSDLDNRRYEQDNAKRGQYDTAGNYEKDLANQRDYRLKKYYDNKENEGRRNAANQYDEADRYGEERYVRKPSYHHDPYYYEQDPYYGRSHVTAPKKTITIYEDPRYVRSSYEKFPQYENDYVELDFRKPSRDYQDYNRYYDRRPSYDYYY